MTTDEGKAWRAAHYKVPEGFKMTTWPRFLALMRRLGVPVPPLQGRQERVCLVYPCGNEEHVTVTINGTTTDTGYGGTEAYHFPESRAYFELLGIPDHMWVLDLRIEFALGEFPTWTMRAALAVPNDLDPSKD